MGKIFYIRHAPTNANLSGDIVKNYDDYDIVDFDRDDWFEKVGKHLPKDFKLLVSPAKRCKQTAKKLFPDKEFIVCDYLSEFDVSALSDAGLKFWEISEDAFKEKIDIEKADAGDRWFNVLATQFKNPNKDLVVIGHGFYGRLIRSIYNDDDDSVFDILNSKNFQFKNLDMMEIQFGDVQNVWRS